MTVQEGLAAHPQLPELNQLRRSLLEWYQRAGRDLPWRRRQDPYPIWISEVMLQQTQVQTVIPYYERWLKAFPNLETLAAADQQTVLKAWQGLGYYSRARNLHQAAQIIRQHHGGQFPLCWEDVLALPGIGRTTAAGIVSAAFNQPQAILDGNVKRILVRLLALGQPPNRILKQLWQLSELLLDPHQPRDFNQALMDLGATVCLPQIPQCPDCPWRSYCLAHQRGLQTHLPMREPRKPLPHKHVGVAVIWNQTGQILIDRRRQQGLLGGLWEFPGGKVQAGETVQACITREILEELGIKIQVGEHLITINHAYTHFRVTLNVHHCQHLGDDPRPLASDEVRWVALEELDQYPFPTANVKIIEALRRGR